MSDMIRATGAYHNTLKMHFRRLAAEARLVRHGTGTFDAANQIASYTGPEGTLDYAYDNTGQLIGVSGDRSETYSFDANCNRRLVAAASKHP
jgi:YD repeat-containing protein